MMQDIFNENRVFFSDYIYGNDSKFKDTQASTTKTFPEIKILEHFLDHLFLKTFASLSHSSFFYFYCVSFLQLLQTHYTCINFIASY